MTTTAPAVRVKSLKGLKTAISSGAGRVIVEDARIARAVRAIKSVPAPVLRGAVGKGGRLIAPSLLLAGAVAFLIVSVGVAVIWAIYKDYDIEATGNVDTPKGSGGGTIILKRRTKK